MTTIRGREASRSILWRRLATVLDEFVEAYQGPIPLLDTPPPGWLMPGFEQTIDDPELLERLRALGYVN